jgi:tetratricopeptide (TPR) repeat protein
MKALEKDRARRYETANELALDVKRFLDHEAVLARPPSKLYKFRKAVQRNRLLFSGIAVIATLLVSSLIVLSTLLAMERQARQESQQVTGILEEMLSGAEPAKARGRNTEMLRDILDRTAERVRSDALNEPAVQAQLCSLIAKAYLDIGAYDQAEKMARIALAKELLYGPHRGEAAASLYVLGKALLLEARLPEAEKALREALTIREQLFGTTHPDVAATLDELGSVYIDQRRLTEAAPLIRRSLEIRRQLSPRNNLATAESLQSLCRLLEAERRWPEPEAAAREFLAMSRQIPGRQDLVAEALDDLAMAAGFNGKLDVQEKSNKEAFAIKQTLLPEDHPYLVKSIANLGEILRLRGNSIEAHAVLAGVISIQRKLLGEAHYDTLASLGSFGQLLATEGKWEEAEKVHREALTIWRKRVGDQHPHSLWEWGQVCHVLVQQRKYQEAEQFLGEILTPTFVKEPACSEILGRRLDLMGRQGRWKEAVSDAEILVQHQSAEYYWPYTLAALLAATHDRAAYEQLCQKLPGAFAETSDPYVAQRIADSCLLLPDSGADMRLVAQLANRAVALGNRDGGMGYFQACKALSDYREGRFSEAVGWAEKARETWEAFARARGCAVVAMAQWRLGLKDVARATLSEGDKLVPNISSTGEIEGAVDLGNNWLNLLLARIQLDEARSLIRSGSAQGNNPL